MTVGVCCEGCGGTHSADTAAAVVNITTLYRGWGVKGRQGCDTPSRGNFYIVNIIMVFYLHQPLWTAGLLIINNLRNEAISPRFIVHN